jgi:hypothetical protein
LGFVSTPDWNIEKREMVNHEERVETPAFQGLSKTLWVLEI